MPYLVLIGTHGAARNNKWGVAARGYWVFRRGKEVVTRWGPLWRSRFPRHRLCWTPAPREKCILCDSASDAAAEVRRRVITLQAPGQGYRLLRPGQRIWWLRSTWNTEAAHLEMLRR